MNHRLMMHKLEDIKRDKLEEMRILQADIRKIEESISNHRKIYQAQNKYSEKCKEVLDGYNRENVREIIKFILNALKNTHGYFEYYKDIDLEYLMDNNDFFDFVISEIGKATIADIKKHFDAVEVHNGETMLKTKKNRVSNENTRNRLWKKLTKKTIITEAKRITSGIE